MNRAALVAVGVAAGLGVWLTWTRKGQDEPAENSEEFNIDAVDLTAISSDFVEMVSDGVNSLMPFGIAVNLEKNSAYINALLAAEVAYGIPKNLLVAQAYQESRFKPEAYNKYSGAMGMMQFMPATAAEWGVTDPYNAMQAITGAAKYMQWLYKQTGDWKLALAAYNWGIGNVSRKGIAKAPKETRDYMAQITTNAGYA